MTGVDSLVNTGDDKSEVSLLSVKRQSGSVVFLAPSTEFRYDYCFIYGV
jgi:hypothetical protein